jgi:glycosyltransferase involved in cell wall biosynthesis
MNITILTFNNKVGILTDAMLLQTLFEKNNINSRVSFLENKESIQSSDIGIWIQNVCTDMMDKFKINIFYINEEWYHSPNSCLSMFDYVICKSQYAKNTFFKDISNVIHIPFLSKDLYNQYLNRNIFDNYKILHFMGKSLQKNTEEIINLDCNITLHDPSVRFQNLHENINHVTKYLSNKDLKEMLNSHNVHICPSLYESWGHYAFEGLSTGAEIICSDIPVFREHLDPDLVHFIPTYKGVDLNYKYCKDNIDNLYPLRESFFINRNYLKELIGEFKPKGTPHMRRMLYKSIMEKNKKLMADFFKSL